MLGRLKEYVITNLYAIDAEFPFSGSVHSQRHYATHTMDLMLL